MQRNELRAERVRRGVKAKDMAALIHKTYSMYQKKERGESFFTIDEIIIIANKLQLTLPQVNAIFFDSKLTSWQH